MMRLGPYSVPPMNLEYRLVKARDPKTGKIGLRAVLRRGSLVDFVKRFRRERGSTISEADAAGTMAEAEGIARETLLQGDTLKMGRLVTLMMTIKSDIVTEGKFDSRRHIRGVRFRMRPGRALLEFAREIRWRAPRKPRPASPTVRS